MSADERRADVLRNLQSIGTKHANLSHVISTGGPNQIPLIHQMFAEVQAAITNLLLYVDEK